MAILAALAASACSVAPSGPAAPERLTIPARTPQVDLSWPVKELATVRCDAAAATALAPTGVLRVVAYPGSPTSMIRDPRSGERIGLTPALGRALADALGVPMQLLERARAAQLTETLAAGEADLTFTNATAARARQVDFAPALLKLELGLLVRPGVALDQVEAIDAQAWRIGVSEGSSSQAALTRQLARAAIVPLPSIAEARTALVDGRIDAFATNKGVLFDLAAQLEGSRVLAGRWGLEHLALATPKGREAGHDCLMRVGQAEQASGRLRREIDRVGLRGVAD